MMKLGVLFLSILVFLFVCEVRAKLKGDDCEVCISFLNKLSRKLDESDISDQAGTKVELLEACEEAKGKDERFCYYIGARENAATMIINEVTRPLSFGKPAEKICEDLKKKDSQICDLRYEKQIDWSTVDLKTLKVKELKKILHNWGEDCKGCAEKIDFINKINDLKHLHTEL